MKAIATSAAALIFNTGGAKALLRQFIWQRCLGEYQGSADGISRSFTSESAYLDFSAIPAGEGLRVSVEFGRRADGWKNVQGSVIALWDVRRAALVRVEAAKLEGASVDMNVLGRHLLPHVDLPLAA